LVGTAAWDQVLDLIVGALPRGKRAGKQVAASPGEFQDAASPIGWVWRYLDQPAALERLQSGS
jgi:hypothetical protein